MIAEDPKERISIKDIMSHPWFVKEELPSEADIQFEAKRVLRFINAKLVVWRTAKEKYKLMASEDNIMHVRPSDKKVKSGTLIR